MSKSKKTSSGLQQRNATSTWLCSRDAYETLCVDGYTRLSDNPEVQMAVNYVAYIISSMTIYLMRNTEKGDLRVRNGLSRKVDIDPHRNTTRKIWLFNIVRNMMLYGNQIVLPETKNGHLDDLRPLSPSETALLQNGDSYIIRFSGEIFTPDEVLHFLINPDPAYPWRGMGFRTPLKDVVHNLRQAAATKKGFMESKWKPSVIVRVDGLANEFANKAGRQKFMKEYLETDEAGEPWIIPAELLDIKEIKPLSLNDLALNDAVTLDKKTVAGIIGVPPYVVGADLYVRGIMTGNEVRNWINLPPKEGLDDLVILENYIPRGMIGAQSKLNGGDKNE